MAASAPRAPDPTLARPSLPDSAKTTAPTTSRAPAATTTTASSPDGRKRLVSIAYQTFIWPKPKKSGRYLGYVRVGQSVTLRKRDTVRGQGCPWGFYAIEPRGYVCKDRTVSTDPKHPYALVNAHTLPRKGAFPYEFALSNGAPMYARVPTATEQKRTERPYGKSGKFRRLSLFQRGHEQLAETTPIAARNPRPHFLANGQGARGKPLTLVRRTIPLGSMLAYTRSFDVGGRAFLLSTDLTIVPADRVRRFRPSQFRGVALDATTKLPLAWLRVRARPQYRRNDDGSFSRLTTTWPVRSWVALSGVEAKQGKKRYLQTTVRGSHPALWLAAEDATTVEKRKKRPFGVRPGEKWMIVSISRGTLVAYENMTPVYTTLISPGQGGIPRQGQRTPEAQLIKDSTTPLGAYRMTFKDRAATMSPQFGEARTFWIADVPFTQYFRAPFALHGTYWHEKFGEPMSAGCVNASLLDAKWLFEWSDPPVPKGWQGATAAGAKENGGTTVFVVTR